MRIRLFAVAALAAASMSSAALAADVTVFNSTPVDTFHYGTGNAYNPANAVVQTIDGGNELSLRFHETGFAAPASDLTGLYSFALGTTPISFDWGIDESFGTLDHTTALITVKNIGTGQTATYNPFFVGNDNHVASGSSQNSARLNFGFLLGAGFTPNVDSSYSVNLAIGGHSVNAVAQLGAGAGAVPEPATWAMMLGGFGIVGASMRRRKAATLSMV